MQQLAADAPFLCRELKVIVATRTTTEWLELCDEHRIPVGKIGDLDELVESLPIEVHPKDRRSGSPRPRRAFVVRLLRLDRTTEQSWRKLVIPRKKLKHSSALAWSASHRVTPVPTPGQPEKAARGRGEMNTEGRKHRPACRTEGGIR
jgi:hypothetical protein